MPYLNRNVPIPFGGGCPPVIEKSFWRIPNTKEGIQNWMTPYILNVIGQRKCRTHIPDRLSNCIQPNLFHNLSWQSLFHQLKLNASILRNTCRSQLNKFKDIQQELNSIPIRMTNIRQSNRQSQFLDKPDLINYS